MKVGILLSVCVFVLVCVALSPLVRAAAHGVGSAFKLLGGA